MFELSLLDILFIFILFLMIEHLFRQFLLFMTTRAAVKQAGIIGSTKEEILKQTTAIVNEVTSKIQETILTKVDTKIKEEVIKIVDAENKNVVLTLSKDKSKKEKTRGIIL